MRVNELTAFKSNVALASGQCVAPKARRVAGLARHHRRDADATNALTRNFQSCLFQMKCSRMSIFLSASG
jgi:hypothetical protein